MDQVIVTMDHHFARDRAPIASTEIPTIWRYRWACTCGAAGHWQDDYPITEAYRDWKQHAIFVQFRKKIA